MALSGLVVVTLAIQAYLAHNPDTSWLLFVARRTLDGAVPYRDILETNPPASFLLYMPAVELARLLGANEIAVMDALVVLATALSLALSGAILDRAALLDRSRTAALPFGAALIFLIMPMSSFAQREHVAVLASLPLLATIGVRSLGPFPRPIDAVLAGLGAGIAIAIKPVFALAFVGPLIFCLSAAARSRPWRYPELWVAATTVLAYGGAAMLFYPEYSTRVWPLMVGIYLPARLDLVTLLMLPTFLLWATLAGLFCWFGWCTDPLGRVLTAASAGFEAAALIQGKGFPYQNYPAVALAALACVRTVLCFAAPPEGRRFHLPPRTVPILAVVLAALWTFDERYVVEDHAPGLSAAIAEISPRPRILTIGSNSLLNESFARDIGAVWVGSEPNAWITFYAIVIDAAHGEPPRFAAAIDAERARYAADIRDERPDAILVEGEWWVRWLRRSPALLDAVADYREAGRFGQMRLFERAEYNRTRRAVSDLAGQDTGTRLK